MPALKSDIIDAAARELRISGLTSTLTPEETAAFLYELENMMAQLFSSGYDVGYVFTNEPDPADDLGVDRKYWPMMQTRLAMQMAPTFGLGTPSDLILKARQSYSNFLAVWNRENLQEMTPSRRFPRGSGNTMRNSRYRRFSRPEPQAGINSNKLSLRQGGIVDTSLDFAGFLNQEFDDDILSFEITASNNLEIQSSGVNGTRVEFRVKVKSAERSYQEVIVTITATSGRITSKTKEFVISNNEVFN